MVKDKAIHFSILNILHKEALYGASLPKIKVREFEVGGAQSML